MESKKVALEVLLSPSLWHRNSKTDPEFDAWLSSVLDSGEVPRLIVNPFFPRSIYEVAIGGLEVWVANAPYADAGVDGHLASRTTALRLRKMVGPLIREHLRFKSPLKALEPTPSLLPAPKETAA